MNSFQSDLITDIQRDKQLATIQFQVNDTDTPLARINDSIKTLVPKFLPNSLTILTNKTIRLQNNITYTMIFTSLMNITTDNSTLVTLSTFNDLKYSNISVLSNSGINITFNYSSLIYKEFVNQFWEIPIVNIHNEFILLPLNIFSHFSNSSSAILGLSYEFYSNIATDDIDLFSDTINEISNEILSQFQSIILFNQTEFSKIKFPLKNAIDEIIDTYYSSGPLVIILPIYLSIISLVLLAILYYNYDLNEKKNTNSIIINLENRGINKGKKFFVFISFLVSTTPLIMIYLALTLIDILDDQYNLVDINPHTFNSLYFSIVIIFSLQLLATILSSYDINKKLNYNKENTRNNENSKKYARLPFYLIFMIVIMMLMQIIYIIPFINIMVIFTIPVTLLLLLYSNSNQIFSYFTKKSTDKAIYPILSKILRNVISNNVYTFAKVLVLISLVIFINLSFDIEVSRVSNEYIPNELNITNSKFKFEYNQISLLDENVNEVSDFNFIASQIGEIYFDERIEFSNIQTLTKEDLSSTLKGLNSLKSYQFRQIDDIITSLSSTKNPIIISNTLASHLSINIGDSVKLSVKFGDFFSDLIEFEVVGIISHLQLSSSNYYNNYAVYVLIDSLIENYDNILDHILINSLNIKLKEEEYNNIPEIVDQISTLLKIKIEDNWLWLSSKLNSNNTISFDYLNKINYNLLKMTYRINIFNIFLILGFIIPFFIHFQTQATTLNKLIHNLTIRGINKSKLNKDVIKVINLKKYSLYLEIILIELFTICFVLFSKYNSILFPLSIFNIIYPIIFANILGITVFLIIPKIEFIKKLLRGEK